MFLSRYQFCLEQALQICKSRTAQEWSIRNAVGARSEEIAEWKCLKGRGGQVTLTTPTTESPMLVPWPLPYNAWFVRIYLE